jgi:hypothetical protein
VRVPVLAAAAVLAASTVASAATPAPKPAQSAAPKPAQNAAPKPAQNAAPKRVNVEQLTPKQLLPKKNEHTEFVVEINKLGQVARVRSGKSSDFPPFNAQTYGNALQAFIRTPDGKAIPGTYRLTYDYDVKTSRVRRNVALLHAGGVNPNAPGAASDMMKIAAKNRTRTPPPGLMVTPGPVPSVNIQRMPDLPQVMKSPTPH